MSNISNYLNERLKTVEVQIERLKNAQKSIDNEIAAINEKQKNISENVDATYELFSPKPVAMKENRESVQILEVNKYELISHKRQLQEQVEGLTKESENIKSSMTDLRRMEAFINQAVLEYHLSQP
ncbi:MAG: hypothetical protein LUE29_00005 [Lachnospiraceae bacterium]|nr:hypothetical protein [Lachnospiraceae bacterium]